MNRRKGLSSGRWPKTLLGLTLLAGLALACSDDPLMGPETPSEVAAPEFWIGESWGALKVMTWNVYVGANLDPLLEVEDPNDIPPLVTAAFQQLLSTNFPERARAIARKVAYSKPHLLGLQEISIVRFQGESDFFVNPTPNAQYVLFDYLDILLKALKARGLNYVLAGQIKNADVELPMVVSVQPLAFADVRLTDFDVVLARADVDIEKVVANNYVTRLEQEFTLPTGLTFTIEVPRGYVMVDATVGGRTYRFVNTHLEPYQPKPEDCPPSYPAPCLEIFQLAQAMELLPAVHTAEYPLIIVGDLNTHGPTPTYPVPGPAYAFLTTPTSAGGAGLLDTWTENRLPPGAHDGLTNAHDADLRNFTVNFTKRIDLILTTVGPSSVYAWVVGDNQWDRTFPQFLWPSDHAGVVARLKFPTGAPLAAGDE